MSKEGEKKESTQPVDDGAAKGDTQKNIDDIMESGLMDRKERGCTDCPMIFLATLFVIGWIIVLVVATQKGSPPRILKPSNFRNDLCGDATTVLDYPNLWIPRASRLSYGLCVPRCPSVGDFVCNNDVEPRLDNASISVPNHYYSMSAIEYTFATAINFKCLIRCNSTEQDIANRFAALTIKLKQYKCFVNWYESGATLYRCLPFQKGNDNATLGALVGEGAEALQKLTDFLGIGSFFSRGFSEMQQCWLVILLAALTCCGVSLVWVFLLRWIMKPIIYLCILLIFALFIIIGYLAMRMADDLESVKLPGDTATENQVKLWRALEYAAFIMAAMYLIIMIWMFKRIKIAIAIMREASHMMLASPGLVVVPPIVFVLFLGWVAFFIVTTIYIQTIGDLTPSDYLNAANTAFGASLVNDTLLAANRTAEFVAAQTNSTLNSTINASAWTTSEQVKWLHAYNFFGFLWASNFCLMYGFFVTAMTGSVYYYSATKIQAQMHEEGAEGGKAKDTPYFTIPRSVFFGIRYHLGTILFGSLLIAIIQFIRVAFLYFKEQILDEFKDSVTVQCLVKYIEYCLWYIQKVIEIISKNAFIVTCIKSTGFCSSAETAMSLIGGNAARVSVLGSLAAVCCFMLKVFIVGTNMIIAWSFINTKSLTQDKSVESGLFPMCGILLISFIIASIFINVYEALVDTTLMCFLVDESEFDKMFLPLELSEMLDSFGEVEAARQRYEAQIRAALKEKRPEGKAE